jgi:hypothetical protein
MCWNGRYNATEFALRREDFIVVVVGLPRFEALSFYT